MPDDHSRNPRASGLAGTGFEAFADPPGFKPPRLRWVMQGAFGAREMPSAAATEGGELLRAMIRSLGSRRVSRGKPGPSRTD